MEEKKIPQVIFSKESKVHQVQNLAIYEVSKEAQKPREQESTEVNTTLDPS